MFFQEVWCEEKQKAAMNSRWRRGWGWGGGTPREGAPGEGELQVVSQGGEGRVKDRACLKSPRDQRPHEYGTAITI